MQSSKHSDMLQVADLKGRAEHQLESLKNCVYGNELQSMLQRKLTLERELSEEYDNDAVLKARSTLSV